MLLWHSSAHRMRVVGGSRCSVASFYSCWIPQLRGSKHSHHQISMQGLWQHFCCVTVSGVCAGSLAASRPRSSLGRRSRPLAPCRWGGGPARPWAPRRWVVCSARSASTGRSPGTVPGGSGSVSPGGTRRPPSASPHAHPSSRTASNLTTDHVTKSYRNE